MKFRKLFFRLFFFSLGLMSCSDNEEDPNILLPNVPVDQTVFLNNPEYIDLQVPGGWAYTQGGIAGIVIYRSGTNNFVAFERSAPHYAPQNCSVMVVKNSIVMQCGCDGSEFSILNGAPLTEGVKVAARQYRADFQGGNVLRITNY